MSAFYWKHFLKSLDSTPVEITTLFELAVKLEADERNGVEVQKLAGRNVAPIFEKDSTHTRCSFEVTAYDRGARMIYLGPSGSQIGHKESIKDTIRVFGRTYDGIQYRGHGQEVVETLVQYAGVSIWNGLTNGFHPTQLLAGLPAMKKHLPDKTSNQITLVYADNARNDMGNSMLEAATLVGLDLCLVAPSAYWPETALMESCTALAKQQGGSITLTEVIAAGVKGADLIYTDVWVSMGEAKEEWAERITLLRDYQVSSAILVLTDSPQVKSPHCLPAFHGDQTMLGKQMAADYGPHGGMEVTDEVFESAVSMVSDQIKNRVRTTKAMMMATLSK